MGTGVRHTGNRQRKSAGRSWGKRGKDGKSPQRIRLRSIAEKKPNTVGSEKRERRSTNIGEAAAGNGTNQKKNEKRGTNFGGLT